MVSYNGVNVIIFGLPIYNTLFDLNIDTFTINFQFNTYWNSIQAGLAFL